MTGLQITIIIVGSMLTGLVISQVIIRGIFGNSNIATGIRKKIIIVFIEGIKSHFATKNLMEDKLTSPAMFEKIKPEIERHVDVFLQEKLEKVFPLLYKFMGEKTLNQFKAVFMEETTLLFPVVIKKHIESFKEDGGSISDTTTLLEQLPGEKLVALLAIRLKKEIWWLRLVCILAGLSMGIIMAGIMCCVQ